jgi:hypothetical protein
MVKLVALKTGRFGLQKVSAGETFETSRKYADIWVRLGKAYPADAEIIEAAPKGKAAQPDAAGHEAADTVGPQAAGETVAGVSEEGGAGEPGAGEPDIETLRAMYAEFIGSPADKRWSARTINEKLAEARAGYQTRAMKTADFG